MKILALETTEKTGGVAAAENGNILASLDLPQDKRSAQSLAPGIVTLLKQVGWKAQDVQLVAVAIGPGSFTGLRIGLATAKLFAYAVGAEILGINTLETIAAGVPDAWPRVSAAVDAQRGEVAACDFVRLSDGWPQAAGPQELIAAEAWLKRLPSNTAVAGPVLKRLLGRLPPHITPVPEIYWRPRAETIAKLAEHHYALGHRDDLWTIVPQYCRRSAAEEKIGGS